MAPLRELPEHSMPLPGTAIHHSVRMSPDDRVRGHQAAKGAKSKEPTPTAKPTEDPASANPVFNEPNFNTDGASITKEKELPPREDVLSPTQT
ncbi:hypothetical protein K458DRAFT_416446 [Lentithecium fluviatile CBS 122367]|uniref:Uncharacterized protein n=1 Tax=Lentithecium fluviatile CBS 122367 TaxID=1168545 RepID=A0A6G1J6S9_9PLEO|nr:hypothetical protein K458DRAFT_416446 [Lentithecium fluviatile CBS 122367]